MSDIATYDIWVRQGNKFELALDYLEDDEVTPINLTGKAARMQIRDKPGGAVLLSFTVDGVGWAPRVQVQPGGQLGRILITAGATHTETMLKGGKYDVEVYDPAVPDDVETILTGSVKLYKQITDTTP